MWQQEGKVHLTETTLDIVAFLGKEPYTPKTIRSISLSLDKAYPLIHSHIQTLLQSKVLKERRVGRSCQCSLQLSNPQTQLLLGFTVARTLSTKMRNIQEKILQESNLQITTVAQTKETLFIVTESNKKECTKLFPYAGVEVLTTTDFKSHLLKLAKKNTFPVPLLRSETFYALLGDVQEQFFHWGEQE